MPVPGQPASASTYTYDPAGNLQAIADTVDTTYNRSLSFDGINRLTVVARLLSSAVHDTRNALQIVTGHAELFAESTVDVAKARAISPATSNAVKLAAISGYG